VSSNSGAANVAQVGNLRNRQIANLPHAFSEKALYIESLPP